MSFGLEVISSNAPAPLPFEVTGRSTRIEQLVEMPHTEQIQLQLFRADGVLFNGLSESIEFRRLDESPVGFGKPEPEGLNYRNLRDEDVEYFIESKPGLSIGQPASFG